MTDDAARRLRAFAEIAVVAAREEMRREREARRSGTTDAAEERHQERNA